MKFQMSVPKPCHENWNKMTPAEKGRFCTSCKKEVIDFTKLSNKQIAFEVNKGKSLCGRLKKEQLETVVNVPEKNSFRGVVAASILLSIISVSEGVIAQVCKKTEKVPVLKNDSIVHLEKKNDFKKVKVFGNVNDVSGGLPGVMVVLKGTTIGAETDFDGNFVVEIPKNQEKKNILVFSFVGYESREVEITNYNKNLKVTLKEDDNILGEVVVGMVISSKPNFFQRFLNIFRKKENRR